MAGLTAEIFWRWVGGRRFLLAVGSGVVNTALLWFGKLSETTFRDLVIATVGVYIAANTTGKIMEKKVA